MRMFQETDASGLFKEVAHLLLIDDLGVVDKQRRLRIAVGVPDGDDGHMSEYIGREVDFYGHRDSDPFFVVSESHSDRFEARVNGVDISLAISRRSTGAEFVCLTYRRPSGLERVRYFQASNHS